KAELEKMGVDVAEMKKELTALESRVKKLEERRYTVAISGDANYLLYAGHGSRVDGVNTFGMNSAYRLVGVGRGAKNTGVTAEPVGLGQDISSFYETAFSFSSTNPTESMKWKGTLVAGNMLSSFGGYLLGKPFLGVGLGPQGSNVFPYGAPYHEQNMGLYVQDLNFSGASKWGNTTFSADIGRVGYQITRDLFFRKPTPDSIYFYQNPRWVNGNYYLDGGVLKLGLANKAAEVHVFGGRVSDVVDTFGNQLNPMMIFSPLTKPADVANFKFTTVDQMLGTRVKVPIQKRGELNLAYLLLDSNTPLTNVAGSTKSVNRLGVYGADLALDLPKEFQLHGAYTKTPYMYNMKNIYNHDNTYYSGKLSFNGKLFGVGLGYSNIDVNYWAPGGWQIFELVYPPAGTKGINADAYLNLTPKLKLSAKGFSYKGDIQGLAATDHLSNLSGTLTYQIFPFWQASLNFSHLALTHTPAIPLAENKRANFATIDTHLALSKKTLIHMGYQYNDLPNGAPILFGIDPAGGNQLRGGFFFTHMMYRF
ncbi:MAG: hypothetical protein ACYCV7_16680, partial [Acidimicrobiales bacterium]